MTSASTATLCPVCATTEAPTTFFGSSSELEGYALRHCGNCGLEWIDPQPNNETLARIYQKDYFDAWGLNDDEESTSRLKAATFRALLKRFAPASGNQPLRLLDCGAATGYLMEQAAAMGMEPYGVEMSEFGAGRIAQRFGEQRIFCGDFADAAFLGVEADYFDVITMTDFIEHVRNPMATLRKAFSLLRPGGRLVIVTPDAGSVSRRAMKGNWLHYKLEHLHYFSSRSIRIALAGTHFEDIRVGRAWKSMNVHYLAHQFARYKRPILSPAVNAAYHICPFSLRDTPFRVTFGELLSTSSKPDL